MRTCTEADNGSTVSLATGEEFEVRLAENASTGHQWHVVDINHNIVEVVRDEPIPPATAVPGATGAHVWVFRARADGQSPLSLAYRRSWEGDAPAQTFSLDVSVI